MRQAALLEQINAVSTRRRALRMVRLATKHVQRTTRDVKSFFARVSTKYGDSTVPLLDHGIADTKLGPEDQANILAENWHPILNRQARCTEQLEVSISEISKNWGTAQIEWLDDDVTEFEVQSALARSKRGKAAGPDRLGNSFYRDFAEELTPILAKLFRSWFQSGHYPESFKAAYKFCIAKKPRATNPLHLRPIALLNTDYKVFTKNLSHRMRGCIADLVHPTQFGFVPGRSIHTAIDLLEAAKVAASNLPGCAQALLLDFEKAYDSLDRKFLLAVLRKKVYPNAC